MRKVTTGNFMIKKLLHLFLPTVLLANPFEITLQDEMQWLEEETFIVSASRVRENIKKTSASVNVIDEEMIEVSSAKNISELLNTIPGISVTQGNLFFNEIEVRGIKDYTSKQVLFMIDGHSIDALLLNGGSTAILDKISLDNIKRIEIVKGPASALYGANAFTALINIITKDVADINGVIVNSKIGSHNTKEVNLLYGQKYDELSLVANTNLKETDGNKVYIKQDRANKSALNNPYLKQLTANVKIDYKDFYLKSMYL
ncbi:MAG: TonB-dependent receptor, partial [Campylobacterales bacterium]|nr:TonB-dependent receptor [Campylobacterales bacterium]